MSNTIYDPDDADSIFPRSPTLQRVEPDLGPERVEDLAPILSHKNKDGGQRPKSEPPSVRPELIPLIQNLGPNNPELAHFDPSTYQGGSEEDWDMPDIAEDPERAGIGDVRTTDQDATTSGKPDYSESSNSHATAVAAAALNHPAASESRKPETKQPSMERNDSAHDEPQPTVEERKSCPLRVDTKAENHLKKEESITSSPTLRMHIIPFSEDAAATLPAMQSSPTKDGQAVSPQTEKLPSVRQITGHLGDSSLNELAEAATQHDIRRHRHSQSLASAVSASPMASYQPTPSAQTSPVASEPYYGSPPYYPQSAYYPRRPSATPGNTPNLPNLPSASSCSDGPGPDYSTAHTTPIDPASLPDSTPAHILPTPPGMTVISGFKCDYPNCRALPFQTQYLLSSHKTVHSSTRNYFCPVEGCKHAEGGKGFKRKNEMNRHSLVHKSPGYTCPFCPDREHKYPRPDNLQRHVRVHHVDKGSNDPRLREVLAQRNDGTGKIGRRQRRNTSSPV